MPRNEIIPKILEILQGQAETAINLIDIFTSDYYTSHRKMRKMIRSGPSQLKTDWAFEYRKRQQFYSLLNKLKNQGLIEKKKTEKRVSLWKITKKGLEKLKLIKENKKHCRPQLDYPQEKDNKIKVVIFDIPEKERSKRDWLRTALLSLDFSLLQESVWIGKNKIPEEFIADLKERGMLSYIQIFEVSQGGTIEGI